MSLPIHKEHRIRLPYCHVTHWKKHSSCRDDEPWSERRIESRHPLSMTTLTFFREQDMEFNDAIRLLEMAYDSGKYDMRQQIKEVLDIKDPR